jgi:hypothetical protein
VTKGDTKITSEALSDRLGQGPIYRHLGTGLDIYTDVKGILGAYIVVLSCPHRLDLPAYWSAYSDKQ